MDLGDRRIRIIVGHYGSGKTEFSINYAVKLAEEKERVILADLDIVNLYFRSREKADELERLGVKVIGSSLKGNGVDLPAITPEIYTPLQDQSYQLILDIGGDPVGARALGRYYQYLNKGEYDMFFILNANRPETQTVEKAIEYLRNIEDISRAKVTGIVNNTHMLKDTTVEDVMRGQKLAENLSEMTNIPIKYTSALEKVAKNLSLDLTSKIFPIHLYMREEWMT